MDRLEYEGLKPFCATDIQLEALIAYFEEGSYRKAAKRLGKHRTVVHDIVSRVKRNAAKRGYSPVEDEARLSPPGFIVRRKSTFYDLETGRATRQWVISEPERARNWEALVSELQNSLPSIPTLTVSKPKRTDKDLLAIYPYGDPHVGMYAWHEDAEDDFDLNEAIRLMQGATQSLVGCAPPAKTALIAFLGDFFHSDNQTNKTARSGHDLDVDSRWAKVLRVGCNTAASLVGFALQQHRNVHVICEIGNHDDHTAVMLGIYLDALFKNNKRVKVDLSPARFHYFRFGQNFIGTNHGDQVKPAQLPGIMAADRPTDWGECKYRRWLTGHIHNQQRFDLPGCEVESFRILPPRDAWAQGAGYRSGRSMDCIIVHRERGEVARYTIRPEDL